MIQHRCSFGQKIRIWWTDGDFAKSGSWMMILRSEKYPAPLSESLPDTDRVVIYQKDGHNVLAMKPFKRRGRGATAWHVFRHRFPLEANMRYRLQFKYESEGPALHVFVKGYTRKKDISDQMADLQSYECQVPPSGSDRRQMANGYLRCEPAEYFWRSHFFEDRSLHLSASRPGECSMMCS